METSDNKPIFQGIKYYLVGPLDSVTQQLLQAGGAVRDPYLSEMIDYVIVSDPTEPEFSEAREIFELPVVSCRWVTLSAKCGVLLPTGGFAPDAQQVFSGVVVSPSGLSAADCSLLWALITFHGGEFTTKLNEQVTHLITASSKGRKYEVAEVRREVEIVSLDWVEACLKENTLISEVNYHPRLIVSEGEIPVKSSSPDISEMSTETTPKPRSSKEVLSRLVSSRIMESWKISDPVPDEVLKPPVTPPPVPLRNVSNTSTRGRGRGGRTSRGGRSPKVSPVYLAREENVPPELCLLGCVFYINEYQTLVNVEVLGQWKQLLTQYGAEVDDSYSQRVTHVLCERQSSDVCRLAVRDGKRIVTIFWLNDVLAERRLMPPSQPVHLPRAPGEPLKDQIIAVTNFEGVSRLRLKHMVVQLGGTYTGYLSAANSLLVTGTPQGEKYKKALEWKMPVVSPLWLSDLWLGDLTPLKLPVSAKYSTLSPKFALLEHHKVLTLMEAWRQPIKVTRWVNPPAIPKPPPSPPTPSKRPKNGDSSPVVLFTSFPKPRAAVLGQQVEQLGGVWTEEPSECTHVVSKAIIRTVKFLTAFGVAQHILSLSWIEASVEAGRFLAESEYILSDPETEKLFDMNLSQSVNKAKEHSLFDRLVFFITPSVVPSRQVLEVMIKANGGKLVSRRPALRIIRQQDNKEAAIRYVVVSCDKDLLLCNDLTNQKIAVHSAEFILTGVLRQELDWNLFKIN